ncbi:14265_t:CDS:2, partial [Cetraspora pellucida]
LEQLVGEGEATRKIPQNVSTYWNTIIRYNKNLDKFKLTLQEETNLQAAMQFLKSFYKTTNVLSSSTYMTL